MLTCVRSKRQRNAAEYALRAIQSSCIKPYIKTIYLYGSCAWGEEKYSSDIDLFLELSESFRNIFIF
jgi:predicted nucleotidyltransferase